jgi:hypothetical protein
MQVDRQPSPWPCVVMLVILSVLCLMVPRYWRHEAELSRAPSARPLLPHQVPRIGGDGASGAWGYSGTTGQFPSDLLSDRNFAAIFGTPSIDQLIGARIGMPQTDDAWPRWPTIEQSSAVGQAVPTESEPSAAAAEVSAPYAEAMLNQAGKVIAWWSTAEVVPPVTAKLVRVYQLWTTEPAASAEATLPIAAGPPANSVSTVRIVNPHAAADLPSDASAATAPVELDFGISAAPWCVPQTLVEQLQRLQQQPSSARWASDALNQLYALTERDSFDGDDILTILTDLRESAQQAKRLSEETEEHRLRVELLRAHWALARRIDRWTVTHDIRVAARFGGRVASRGETIIDGTNRSTAQADELTLALETYEQNRDPQLGRQIVADKRALEQSADSLDRSLADAVEQHYRNANIRVAITAEMMNRYMEKDRSEVRALRNRIDGAAIRGQSHMQSTSRIELSPATNRWQVGVESEGTVESNALADGGEARLRSRFLTDFAARKQVVVDSHGVALRPTSVDVKSHNRLMGVTTDYDWVPVFGSYARDRAVQQYHARQSKSRVEVEARVANEAAETMDRETRELVERAESQIRQHFNDRLANYGIKVTPVEMTTTHERVVARLRVASDEQPGSHTPRPRALSDSLASVQLHESALTNSAVSLELDARRYTASELQAQINKKFPQLKQTTLTETQRATTFQFAAKDAVQFRIDEGRLEIALKLASVVVDGRTMRNFVVHAYYVPVVDGLEAELARDKSLGIEGRLSSADRARLHNVFNGVLPLDRRMPIVRLDDPNDPRLTGLMITQLVLEDGWLGLAVGPAGSQRVAERSRSLR